MGFGGFATRLDSTRKIKGGRLKKRGEDRRRRDDGDEEGVRDDLMGVYSDRRIECDGGEREKRERRRTKYRFSGLFGGARRGKWKLRTFASTRHLPPPTVETKETRDVTRPRRPSRERARPRPAHFQRGLQSPSSWFSCRRCASVSRLWKLRNTKGRHFSSSRRDSSTGAVSWRELVELRTPYLIISHVPRPRR